MTWPTKQTYQEELGTVIKRHKELESEVLAVNLLRMGAVLAAEENIDHEIAIFQSGDGKKVAEGNMAVVNIGEEGQVYLNLNREDMREIRNGLTEKQIKRQNIPDMRLKNHHDEIDYGPQDVHCPACGDPTPFRPYKLMVCKECGKRFEVDMNPTDDRPK